MGPGQHFGLHRDLGHEEGIGIGPLSPLTSRVGRRGSFGALAAVQRSPGGLAASAPMAGHASLASQPLRRRLQRGTRRHLGPTDEGRAARVHIVRGRRGRLGGAWAGTSEGTSRFSVIPTTLRQQRPSDHKASLVLSQVRFDGNDSASSNQQTSVPTVLFATEDGALAQASAAAVPGPESSHGLEVSSTFIAPSGHIAINSFDVEAGLSGGRDVVAVTDSCEPVYISRGG